MSFALEFRRKHFLAQPGPKGGGRGGERQLSRRNVAAGRADTRASRAVAVRALLLAAAILAIFNSDGLRIAAGDLAERGHGRTLLALSEAWDAAMERAGAKAVMGGVRGLVAEAKGASWADVVELVGAPVLALTGKGDGEGAPDQYTGSLSRPLKHALDLQDFSHSGAAGH
jgi:hypothetical protein